MTKYFCPGGFVDHRHTCLNMFNIYNLCQLCAEDLWFITHYTKIMNIEEDLWTNFYTLKNAQNLFFDQFSQGNFNFNLGMNFNNEKNLSMGEEMELDNVVCDQILN